MLALAVALALPQPADSLADYYLVEIRPGPKRYFYDSNDTANAAAARAMRAYVVAGDRLVASGSHGGFTRVTFVGDKGSTTEGWIETAALERVALPPANRIAWSGKWTAGDAEIEVRPGSGPILHVEASAVWGAQDPQRVAMGAIHTGEFRADWAPSGDRFAFSVVSGEDGENARPFDDRPEDEFRCRVKLRLLGPYLVAEDNNQCGGANVTFTGTYRRSNR